MESRSTVCNRLVFCFFGAAYGNAGKKNLKRGSDDPIRIRNLKSGYGQIQRLSIILQVAVIHAYA